MAASISPLVTRRAARNVPPSFNAAANTRLGDPKISGLSRPAR